MSGLPSPWADFELTDSRKQDFLDVLAQYEVDPKLALRRLEAADAALDERGWTRGAMEDDKGRVCAVGALNVAVHKYRDHAARSWQRRTMRQALERALGKITPSRSGVIGFNDMSARDRRDVHRLFRIGINILKGQTK